MGIFRLRTRALQLTLGSLLIGTTTLGCGKSTLPLSAIQGGDENTRFTLMSYNVENLFDQQDERRNEGYGDYRIKPNSSGQHSNYGELVKFGGQSTTFTEVKIAGIRRVLTVGRPDIVALQEVESRAVLMALLGKVGDLGYRYAAFSDWNEGSQPNAVGTGVISKHPILTSRVLEIPMPSNGKTLREPLRPIQKVTLDIRGTPFIVYNNHWKSKGGPESFRLATGRRLRQDIDLMLAANPQVDFAVVGDLNSDYNEAAHIEPRHNDTKGRTGINHELKSQGDELRTLRGEGTVLYDLHYELKLELRRTAFHGRYGWSSMDHIILGPGVYDLQGVTYVDNSFVATNAQTPGFEFLFANDGTTHRWQSRRQNNRFTKHSVGGYSDHAPVFATFQIGERYLKAKLKLVKPGRPDRGDPVID